MTNRMDDEVHDRRFCRCHPTAEEIRRFAERQTAASFGLSRQISHLVDAEQCESVHRTESGTELRCSSRVHEGTSHSWGRWNEETQDFDVVRWDEGD